MPQHFPPPEEPRVGKRLRRKPQRWEGDRDAPATSDHHGSHAHATANLVAGATAAAANDNIANDTDTTATVMSNDSRIDTPVVEDGLGNLHRAVETARAQPCPRDMVDYLHSWQLRAVSQQAAQLKALHVVLKRRLRKRSGRSPEHDRLEEEALRNARRAPKFPRRQGERDGNYENDEGQNPRKRRRHRQDDDHENHDEDAAADGEDDGGRDEDGHSQNGARTTSSSRRGETDETRENRINMNDVVPSEVRLPLEAYLPRRVRPLYLRLTSGDLNSSIMPPSEHRGLDPSYDAEGIEKWRALPTVPASAEWNTRKSSVRRPTDNVRTSPAVRDEIEHA